MYHLLKLRRAGFSKPNNVSPTVTLGFKVTREDLVISRKLDFRGAVDLVADFSMSKFPLRLVSHGSSLLIAAGSGSSVQFVFSSRVCTRRYYGLVNNSSLIRV